MNIVFDLGGTFVRCAVVGDAGLPEFVERKRLCGNARESTRDRWADALTFMKDFTRRMKSRLGEPESIVISFPGPVDARGNALYAPTVSGARFKAPDLRQIFSRLAACPVYLLNDVSAAAWFFGETCRYDRFIVVTVSSGIGAKVYDRARTQPVIDSAPYAGELGHLTVDTDPGAPLCDCGERGHLGAVASGRAVERAARIIRARANLSNEEDLVPAARAGEEWALTIIRQSIAPLARELATAITAFGLQQIIVFGGFACAVGPAYAAMLESAIRQRLAPAIFGTPQTPLVSLLDVSDEVCLKGAALFAHRSRAESCA